jgi:hypothetical protein
MFARVFLQCPDSRCYVASQLESTNLWCSWYSSTRGVSYTPCCPMMCITCRLLAYARSVAHFPTAVKEFSWRNG